FSGVAQENSALASRVRVPQSDRVTSGGGESAAVRAPAQCVLGLTAAPGKSSTGPSGFYVPELDRPVHAGTGQAPAVRAPAHRHDPAGIIPEDGGLLSGVRVPEPDRLVAAGTGQLPAVGAPADGIHKVGVPAKGEDFCSGVGVPEPDC